MSLASVYRRMRAMSRVSSQNPSKRFMKKDRSNQRIWWKAVARHERSKYVRHF